MSTAPYDGMPTREMVEGTRLHNLIEDGVRRGLSVAQILEAEEAKAPMPTTVDYNGSLSEQIRLLPVGKSAAKVELIDWDKLCDMGDANRLQTMRSSIRNSLASAISRAQASTGGIYGIEVSEASMPAGNIYVVAVVTRIV